MRVKEFANTKRKKTPKENNKHIGKENAKAMVGVRRTRDVGGYDRVYHMNRLWMAMACADGKSSKRPEGVDSESWAQKYNTIHPYTKEEDNMVKQAMKVVPTDEKTLVKSKKSQESDEVNKSSPIQGFKGFKKN